MARSKGQRGYEIQLAFCVAGIQLLKYPKRRCLRMDSANHRRKTSLFFCSAKPSKRCHDIATCIGLVRLAPPAEEQSGDRQRREKGPPILTAEKDEHERAPKAGESYPTPLRATLQAPPSKWAIKAFFPAGERSELSRREAWPQWGLGRSPKRPAGKVGGEQSDRQGAMRHRTPRARGQPLRAVCPRNVVRLFRPLGRNWTTRINSGRPTVRLPQTEAWAERKRVPSGHNCRRQLATGRPEQITRAGHGRARNADFCE